MRAPSHLTLPVYEPDEPVSVWSDDELDPSETQRAMDEWVSEVNRFLGGSARRADGKRPPKSTTRPKKTAPPEPSTPPTPRASPRTPKHSPRWGMLASTSPSTPRPTPSTPSLHGSSGPPTPTVFRPYTPQTPLTPRPSSRPSLPPRPFPPITPPPERPAPTDIPEDIHSNEDDDYFGLPMRVSRPPSLQALPEHPARAVHFVSPPISSAQGRR